MTCTCWEFDPRDPKRTAIWMILALCAEAVLVFILLKQLGIIQ